MGISMAPGNDKDRKRLVRLLSRAANVSHTLDVRLNNAPLESDLGKLVASLEEFISYRTQKL